MLDYEEPKFKAQTSLVVLDLVFVLLGILGYYVHKSWLTWICQLCLFISIPFFFIIIAMEATYMAVGIDFCQSTRIAMLSGSFSAKDQGIGEYITCPAVEIKRHINTGIFLMSQTYNILYSEAIELYRLYGSFDSTRPKRDNEYLKELYDYVLNYNSSTDRNETDPTANETQRNMTLADLKALVDYNHLLGDLKSLVSCQAAEYAINGIESSYCINNFGKVGSEIVAYLVGMLGIFILAVGLNKVILIIHRDASRVLRGNKKYQEEALEEINNNEEEEEEEMGRGIN